MTRIDFYQLDAARHHPEQIVCRLCQKAWEARQMTLLLTRDAEHSQQLDQRLWTWSDESFLPHDCDDDADFATPILVHDNPDPKGDRHLLINLSVSVPTWFAQFERVIELVTEDNRQQAREHYSYYKERGYPLNHVAL